MPHIEFPRTGRPALRALENAGYEHLEQLNGVPMASLLALHGMGPKGIGALRRALAEHGWALADDDPRVGATSAGVQRLESGLAPDRNANATAPTGVQPRAWVAALPTARRREQGTAMLDLFDEVTATPALMWGPSIVGYGELHYTYESGRQGDMPRVGFSPRASALSLYGLQGAPESAQLLQALGKHRAAVSCLYVNKLADVDLGVLRELVAAAWRHSLTETP